MRLFYLALCAFFAMMIPLSALAQESDIAAADDSAFVIEGIKVDVTDKSAVAARARAFNEAQADAFEKLAQTLLPADRASAFKAPEVSVISPLIKDFEITGEQLSKVRYIATYKFRFDRTAVTQYFGGQGEAVVSTVVSRPVLILPFYQWGARNVLWGGDNPWLAAWTRAGDAQSGLVPVVVPIGDLEDVSDVSDDQALTYSPDNLRRMLSRYDAGDAIILIAVPEWPEGAAAVPTALNITMYRTGGKTPEYAGSKRIEAQSGDVPDVLYSRAVTQVRATLQDDWKERTTVDTTQSGTLKARVRFGVMKEWVDMQKALKSVQGVNEITLLSLKPGLAQIELAYHGTADQLRLALAQAGLALTPPLPAPQLTAPDVPGVAASPPATDEFYELSLINIDAGYPY